MRPMQILLIEDEKQIRNEYKNFVSTLRYPNSLHIAKGETEGLRLVQLLPFDIILLDLELHYSDGDGMDFLKKIKQIDLPEIPHIIVITNNSSEKTWKDARDLGGDYIIWKGKEDYSIKFVYNHARSHYTNKLKSTPDEPKQIKKLTLEEEIKFRISKIGINDDMKGRKYTIDAISIVIKSTAPDDISLNKDVYPIIAKKYSKSAHSIRSGIQNAISKAWDITDPEIRAENYTAVISGANGSPTNREFIFYYATQIRDLCRA